MKRRKTIRDTHADRRGDAALSPRCEPLEPRVLLSAATTAELAIEQRGLIAYEASAPQRGDIRNVDYNGDGVVNAADSAARPGHDTPGESSLRIGGAYATDPVPGNAALSGVVIAGYGDAGGGVSLGSGWTGSFSRGLIDQTELDSVLTNWGGGSSSTPRTTDLLEFGLLVSGDTQGAAGSRVLTRQAPQGDPTARGISQFDYETYYHEAVEDGLNLGAVGFVTPDIEVPQGTFMPLGLSVGSSGGYELVADYDNGWGDPFAQGVGAAITSSGELALIAAGGYVGGFDLTVTDLANNQSQTRYILVSPRGHGVVREAALPSEATPDAEGVWRFRLPTTDSRGEPLEYDVSFKSPNPGGYRWNAVAVVDDDGVLTVDRQTIDEMWRDRVAAKAAWLEYQSQRAAYEAAHDAWEDARPRISDRDGREAYDAANPEPQRSDYYASTVDPPGWIAFDGLHLQSMPFTLELAVSDGWSTTSWTHRMSFTPYESATAPNVGLGETLRDVVIDADSDEYAFLVPAYDRDGDAVDYDVWLSTGEARIEPFVAGDQHRVTVTSPYLGIQNIRVRLKLSDGGAPVGHTFVLRARGGVPDGPYVELPDIRRDAAAGSIITVPLPEYDRAGQKFTYDARIVPVDAAGRLMFDWQERSGGSTGGGVWISQLDPDMDGISGENRGANGLFADVSNAFNQDWSPIASMARVLTRSDRLGIVMDPGFVGQFAVVVRATLESTQNDPGNISPEPGYQHGSLRIYDAFRVTVDRASTPRSLDALVGTLNDVTKPAERRGFFKLLPRTDDRGRPIAYQATSTARDWVDIGLNKAGQFGMNVVPKRGFGGEFGITLTAAVGGERVTRSIDYTVRYPEDWSPLSEQTGVEPSALYEPGRWVDFDIYHKELGLSSAEAYALVSGGLIESVAHRHDAVLAGNPGLLDRIPSAVNLSGAPAWSMALPGNDSDGTPLTYQIATSAGRWATVQDVNGTPRLMVRPPGNFTGRFRVEVVAIRPDAVSVFPTGPDSHLYYILTEDAWVGHRVFEVAAQ